VPTGGIGATINIITHKPLASPGQKATFAIEMLDDATTQKGSATPQFSGLYSNTTDDGKFGISLSASYSERESGSQKTITRQFLSFTGDATGLLENGDQNGFNFPNDGTQTNRYEEGEIVSIPQDLKYQFEEQQRERTNAQLTLQYRPMDNLTATLDYTYVNKVNDTQNNEISAWFSPGIDNISTWLDGPNASPAIYSVNHTTGLGDIAIGAGDFSVKDGSKSLGINIEWQATEVLTFNFDHHMSTASSKPNSVLGSGNSFQMFALARVSTGVDFGGERPNLAIIGDLPQAEDFVFTGSNFGNSRNNGEISQTQAHGELILEGSSSIDFGIALTTSENRSRSRDILRNNSWETGEGITDTFDNMSGGNFEGSRFTADDIFPNYYAFDFVPVIQIAEANLGLEPGNIGDCGTSFCPSTDYASGIDRYIQEEMTSVYAQYNYDGDIGNMYYDLHIGIRYEETEITSTSANPEYEPATLWTGIRDLALVNTGNSTFLTREGSYDHLLPALNFNLNATDDVVLRAAFSKTIGRPRYGSMISGIEVFANTQVTGGRGKSGNPGLLPLESTNIDFSAEWYYDEGSYVSLAYFTKNVKNDLNQTLEVLTAGIYNPGEGPYAEAAIAAVGSVFELQEQKQYIFDTFGESDPENVFLDDDGNIVIKANPATDALLNITVDTPGNSQESTGYKGIEFAVQHLFGESGFGGIINFTKTDTDNEFDDFSLADNQVAEVGISDSANLVAFYEKDGLSIRGAYNWRSRYLVATSQGDLGTGPRYVDEYAQLDMTISYDVPQVEGLNVYLNGINITEENLTNSGRTENQILDAIQQGARWSVGARYSF
jgi:TonB-dependent receptor